MLVHRSAIDRHEKRFCLQVLRGQLGCHVHPCHRLDKPTSGVLLFALDKEAHRAASKLFSEGVVCKRYQAIVRGWLDGEGRVDHPLRHLKDGGVSRGSGEPQSAITDWRLINKVSIDSPIGRYSTARYSCVELSPKSGRMHQLRRHMKHVNHHIIGDTCYGAGLHNRFFRERFNCHRLLLVANELGFRHPFSGEFITISMGSDSSFEDLLQNLEEYTV